MKKNTGTQYSLKSIGTVKNRIFYYGKVIPGKGNVLKTHLAVEIIQEKENTINVSTV